MILKSVKIMVYSVGVLLALLVVGWFFTKPSKAFQGVWKTRGHGAILQATPYTFEIYNVTETSCYRYIQIPASMWLLETVAGMQLRLDEQTLLVDGGGLDPVHADKLDQLPSRCDAEQDTSLIATFDVFWETFNEHYAFFDLYGMDWDALYAEYQPKVSNVSTEAELFAIMTEMLADMDDGHVGIMFDKALDFSPWNPPDWYAEEEAFSLAYHPYLQGEVVTIDNAHIVYGWLDDGIGYVKIGEMVPNKGFFEDEVDIGREAMQQVAAALSSAEVLVVDVRFNPGGFDRYSLMIAELFTSERVNIFAKSTRTDTGYTEPFEVYLAPSEPALFTQPVYLLTNSFTASAAEIFTLAMRTLPQVTVIGEATSGGLSDVMERQLPSGLMFGLSNQRYIAADGNLYEGVGIPPDIERPVDVEGFRAGKDTLLEEVILISAETP